MCPECGGNLGRNAVKCRCGWSAKSTSIYVAAHIQCCFEGCPESAVARIFTKTGYVNVCRTDWPRIERAYVQSDTQFVQQCRDAWKKKLAAGEKAPLSTPALGIPLDDLEQEFADLANP